MDPWGHVSQDGVASYRNSCVVIRDSAIWIHLGSIKCDTWLIPHGATQYPHFANGRVSSGKFDVLLVCQKRFVILEVKILIRLDLYTETDQYAAP